MFSVAGNSIGDAGVEALNKPLLSACSRGWDYNVMVERPLHVQLDGLLAPSLVLELQLQSPPLCFLLMRGTCSAMLSACLVNPLLCPHAPYIVCLLHRQHLLKRQDVQGLGMDRRTAAEPLS